MGFESGFKMGSDLIDKIGQRRESRSKSDYYDSMAEKNRREDEEWKAGTEAGAGRLGAGRAIPRENFPEGPEGEKAWKAAKKVYNRANPQAGTRNRAARGESRTTGLENKKIKAAAKLAEMQNKEFKKVSDLTTDVQRGRRIEASVQQAEKNVAATAASTAKTDADTAYREQENDVFGANHKANLANMASTDAANLINAQARMMDAQRMSSAAKTAEAELTALNAVDGAINSYIGSARRQLTNPEWRGLPSKIFSDGEDLLNRMPRNTQAQIKAHNAARQTWEEFRKDAKTSSDYAISRARQAHHSMGMSYISGVALDTYKRLAADPLKAEQAAEMVGKAATVAEFVAAGIPLSALVDPDQSREFFHYEQSKINPWHSTKSIGPNGQEIWTPIMEGDKAIPNMVLNVEQSRLLAQQYITKFKAKQGRLTATQTTRVTGEGGDATRRDALAALGEGGEGGAVTTTTISGYLEGDDLALRETSSLRTKLEAATTSEDIAKLLKDVTDPAADLWALTGEGSEQFGGSGMVGGSGDDNQPATSESPDISESGMKALEKIDTIKRDIKEFSEEIERRGGATDPELSVPTRPGDAPTPKGDTPPESVTPKASPAPEDAPARPASTSINPFNKAIEKDIKRAKKQGMFHLPKPVLDVRSALYGTGFSGFANKHPNYGHMVNYFYGKYGSDPSKWESKIGKNATRKGKFLQTENVPFKFPVGEGGQLTWSEADLSVSRRRKLAAAMAELARQYKYDK